MIISLLCALLASPAPETPLVVASYSYPAFDRSVALTPLAELVAQATGRPARIVLFDTPDALSEAACAGKVDVAMTNLGAYVTMRDCAGVGAVAVLDTPPAVLDRYRGVLLAGGYRCNSACCPSGSYGDLALQRSASRLDLGRACPGRPAAHSERHTGSLRRAAPCRNA